jgi:hypothetical protein
MKPLIRPYYNYPGDQRRAEINRIVYNGWINDLYHHGDIRTYHLDDTELWLSLIYKLHLAIYETAPALPVLMLDNTTINPGYEAPPSQIIIVKEPGDTTFLSLFRKLFPSVYVIAAWVK